MIAKIVLLLCLDWANQVVKPSASDLDKMTSFHSCVSRQVIVLYGYGLKKDAQEVEKLLESIQKEIDLEFKKEIVRNAKRT